MHAARIERSLHAGGAVLVLLYGGLWWLLGTTLADGPEPDALVGTPYKVTTPADEVYVLAIDSPDPARPLLEATERYGEHVAIERIEQDEAIAILRRQRSTQHWALALLVFPVAFFVTATRIGRRGRTLDFVYAAIAPTLSVDLATLAHRTSLDERTLHDAVERIRALGLADLVWDEEKGRVYDERLSGHSITLQACPHCAEPIVARIRADLSNIPQCPSCMSIFDADVLARMNRGLVERLQAEPPRADGHPHFSLGAFALWTLLFPPVALLHALRAAA